MDLFQNEVKLDKQQLWLPPSAGFFKINVDGAVLSQGKAAAGGSCRNHRGEWLEGYTHGLGRASIQEAELWAVFDGLQLGEFLNCNNIIIESDSYEVVDLFNQQRGNHHQCESLIRACESKYASFTTCEIVKIGREANRVVDSIAKQLFVLLVNPPDPSRLLLLIDVNSIE